MKITDVEKKKVLREVKPSNVKLIDWGNGITEEWRATEIYIECITLDKKCTFSSSWHRKFTVELCIHD